MFRIVSRELAVSTRDRLQLIDLTDAIADALAASGIGAGLAHLFCLHTTAVLLVNEFQEALLDDARELFSRLVDERGPYRHNQPEYSDCRRQNAAAHLRSLLFGPGLTLQVAGGRAQLGLHQRVIFAEMDGPRERKVCLQVVGE